MQEPRGAVEIEVAVQDLLQSVPQYTTLIEGKDLGNIAGQSKGNKPSQEGGIFGGGCYAAESEREILSARSRAGMYDANKQPAMPAEMKKHVNNASSIEGGCARCPHHGNLSRSITKSHAAIFLTFICMCRIFGTSSNVPDKALPRTNRSNQSSVQGGIFAENMAAPFQPPSRNGRNANESSIKGGIFG